MRQSQKSNRPRNKSGRKPSGPSPNRVYESNGPEGKVRGTPQQIIDKYQSLARDKATSGDRILSEAFLQHAEHYMRILSAAQPQRQEERGADDRSGDERGADERYGDDGGEDRGRDDRGDERATGRRRDEGAYDDRDEGERAAVDGLAVIGAEEDAPALIDTPESGTRRRGRRPMRRKSEEEGGETRAPRGRRRSPRDGDDAELPLDARDDAGGEERREAPRDPEMGDGEMAGGDTPIRAAE
ncbi:MAG: DUF4167 domain-containing protein [Pseudomonadota bacterium]